MKTKITQMQARTRVAIPLAWVFFLALTPASIQAGGVVQELRTAPSALLTKANNNTSRDGTHKAHSGMQEAPPNATPTTTTKPITPKPELVSLFYDPIQKHTVIRWKAFIHEGQQAIRYHIYRWSLSNTNKQLIAKVSGNIFEFIDTAQTFLGEVYFYDIVGIYHVDGQYESWQYPSQKILPQQITEAATPPQAGIGCSALSQTPMHNGWLWLLSLPLFFLLRSRKRDSLR